MRLAVLLASLVALAANAGEVSPICAVGDMHGDMDHALHALRLCGVVDAAGNWIGGSSTVVQTGDVMDRGNASLPLLELLWSLREQAAAAGGELLMLMGNHELLNMQGATHYVEQGELSEFGGVAAWRRAMHPRRGEYGHRLSAQPGAAVRGEGACRTLFLHAGLRLSVGAAYSSVDGLNTALTAQVRANSGPLLDSRTGPLWFRGYARPNAASLTEDEACAELRATVASFGEGALRMTVGHNIVPFVATRCEGALHMIDVGMSGAYGGRPAAWRCALDQSTHQPIIRALYLQGEEPPPDLCAACEGVLRPHDAPLRGRDPHGDCRNYCRTQSGAARRLSSMQLGGGGSASAQSGSGGSGGGGSGGGGSAESHSSLWSTLFATLGGGSSGLEDRPSAVANHVKTEF